MTCSLVFDDARAADGTLSGRLVIGERTVRVRRWRKGDNGHVLFEIEPDAEAENEEDWREVIEFLAQKAKPGG